MTALGLSSCGGGSGSGGTGPTLNVSPVRNTGTVKSVGTLAPGADACASLEAIVKAMAESQVRKQFAAYAAPAWYPGFSGFGGPAVYALSAGAPSAVTSTNATGSTADSAYSKTNIQYAGVDEMDWVKNDGSFLWTLATQSAGLVLTKAALTPANAMQKVAQITWPQSVTVRGLSDSLSPEGMFLLGNGQIAAVLSGGMGYGVYWADVATSGAMATVMPGPFSAVQPYTELRILETQGASFAVAQTWKINGRLLAARRMTASDALVLVTEAPVVWPANMVWYPNVGAARSQAELNQLWTSGLKTALDTNLTLIAAQPLAAWLGQDAAPGAAECASFSRVDAENNLALTRVTTIDPVSKTTQQAVLLTEGSGVYVSAQSIVLSSRRWAPFDGRPWQDAWTDLHRFSLDAAGKASYQASGKIAGWLINRFAMDEVQKDGRVLLHLAVSNRSITSSSPSFSTQSYSYLASLEQKGNALVQLAATEPIAPGETLQSARFVGDKAYLVTFRVVDPFFIYDLGTPGQIVAQGQLKVPGYSTYLHPVTDTLIFGLGLDSGSWPRRVKASLFDVSNPALPVEVGTQVIGDSNSWSEALWEPHALTFYPATAPDGSQSTWVGVPVGSDIKLLRLSGTGGLSLQGSLDMAAPEYDYARRSVFAGSNVYGIARTHIKSTAILAPGTSLGFLSLVP